MVSETSPADSLRELLDNAAQKLQLLHEIIPSVNLNSTHPATTHLTNLLYPYKPETILDAFAARISRPPTKTEQMSEVINLALTSIDLLELFFYNLPYDITATALWSETKGAELSYIRAGISPIPFKYSLNVFAQLVHILDPNMRNTQIADLTNDPDMMRSNLPKLTAQVDAFLNAYTRYVIYPPRTDEGE